MNLTKTIDRDLMKSEPERAYRMAVVDGYSILGMNQEAVNWLWMDLAAYQGGN